MPILRIFQNKIIENEDEKKKLSTIITTCMAMHARCVNGKSVCVFFSFKSKLPNSSTEAIILFIMSIKWDYRYIHMLFQSNRCYFSKRLILLIRFQARIDQRRSNKFIQKRNSTHIHVYIQTHWRTGTDNQACIYVISIEFRKQLLLFVVWWSLLKTAF